MRLSDLPVAKQARKPRPRPSQRALSFRPRRRDKVCAPNKLPLLARRRAPSARRSARFRSALAQSKCRQVKCRYGLLLLLLLLLRANTQVGCAGARLFVSEALARPPSDHLARLWALCRGLRLNGAPVCCFWRHVFDIKPSGSQTKTCARPPKIVAKSVRPFDCFPARASRGRIVCAQREHQTARLVPL